MSASGHRPSLIRRGLWETRRDHYVAVFERALLLVRQHKELPVSERLLVRKLRTAAVTARRELDPSGKFERPVFESQNLPDADFEAIPPHESKIPDCQWIHDDPAATDDSRREKAFVIECKRLGRKTSSTWDLNEQYVIGGVARFHSPLCRYGNHMHEGMMIGFVQDMDLEIIHTVVNSHLTTHGFPEIQLQGVWNESGISCFDHPFERPFPVSPFRLMHRWLDLRDLAKAPLFQPELPRLH